MVTLIIILLLTLPFYYFPSHLMIFPKDNLTFSYSIITQEDIDNLLKRHNVCENIFQQESIRTEPIFRKLINQGIIFAKKKE